MLTNILNRSSLTISTIAAIVAVSGFASAAQAQIKADGSSTVFPITEKAAASFQGGKKVTVAISGTGGGFKKFCSGETDISNASRPIAAKEMKACADKGVKYIELMVGGDAITVVVNKSNPITSITKSELNTIWKDSAIKNWNEVNSQFPSQPLKLFGPGPEDGTFDYFTEVINGKAKVSRTDYTPSEDDNVLVQGVSRDKNALGYFGYAYFKKNESRLKALSINGVPATLSNIESRRYPLARPLFVYVNADRLKNNGELKSFVEIYVNNAGDYARSVGYLGLSSTVTGRNQKVLSEVKTGTRFEGKERFDAFDDLAKLDPK